MLEPVRTLAPSVKVISVDEAKTNMKIDHIEDDGLIADLIDAATAYVEGWHGGYGFAMIQQTWTQAYDGFAAKMRLPIGRAIAITSVDYFDANNAAQTMDLAEIMLFHDALGSYICLAVDASWPSTKTRPDAITIEYTAGFGDEAADVPASIKQSLKLIVAHWYDNREDTSPDEMYKIPLGAHALLQTYNKVGT